MHAPRQAVPAMLAAAALAATRAAATHEHDGCQLGWHPLPHTLENTTCLPSWTPTWGMRNSTVLCTCNTSGMHDVRHANQFGVVVGTSAFNSKSTKLSCSFVEGCPEFAMVGCSTTARSHGKFGRSER